MSRNLSKVQQLVRDRRWADGSTFFCEFLSHVSTDVGSVILADPSALIDQKITEENVNELSDTLNLDTGGDGNFEVWAIYSLMPSNNLPLEYRIVIQSEDSEFYISHSLTRQETQEFFRKVFNLGN